MTDRLAVVTRLALLALANFYAAGKVTIIELFRGDDPSEVVNVSVTGRPELRDQLADAIISCDVYHVHEPSCYPWESWTTEGGANYRGFVGQLLTMWVRIEELTGYTPQPAASDPAAVPGVPTSVAGVRVAPEQTQWLDTGAGPGWPFDVPPPRPPVVDAAFPSFADWKRRGRPVDLSGFVAEPVGIARVNATLTDTPVIPGLTAAHPLAVLLDDTETARELTEGSAMAWPTAGEAPATHPAWRKWAMHAIEQDARSAGPYFTYADALAVVRSHPAVKSLDPDDVVSLAYGLVMPPPQQPRTRRWGTLRGIIRTGMAE